MKNIKRTVIAVLTALPLLAGCGSSSVHTHTYNLNSPIWDWNGYTQATLSFSCYDGDDTVSVSAYISSTIVKKPTCTEEGKTIYTAEATYEGQTFTDTKTEITAVTEHDYDSLKVSGTFRTVYEAFEQFDPTGIKVSKVCWICEREEELSASDYTISYATASQTSLLASDTYVIVSAFDGTIKKEVPITVNKKPVEKPAKDESEFVYNGEELTYNVPKSDYYTVSGTTKTDAGKYKVIISLNDQENYEWSDGSSDDLIYEFVISKAANSLSGVKAQYNTTCHKAVDISGVTSVSGDVSYKIYKDDALTEEVAVNHLDAGSYFFKVYTEGGTNYLPASVTVPLVVTHDYSEHAVDSRYCKSEATCTADGVYYCSCLCGEAGTETFTQEGSMLDHDLEYKYDGEGHWQECKNGCGYVTSKEAHTMSESRVPTDYFGRIISACECGYSEYGDIQTAIDLTSNRYGANFYDGGSWDATTFDWQASTAEDRVAVTSNSITYNICNWRNYRIELPRAEYKAYGSVSYDISLATGNGGGNNYVGIYEGVQHDTPSHDLGTSLNGLTGKLTFNTSDSGVKVKLTLGSVIISDTLSDDVASGKAPFCVYFETRLNVNEGEELANCAVTFSNAAFNALCDNHEFTWVNNATKIGEKEGICDNCGYYGTNGTVAAADEIDFTQTAYGAADHSWSDGDLDVSGWNGDKYATKFFVTGTHGLSYEFYYWKTFKVVLPRVDYTKYSCVQFTLGTSYSGDSIPTGAFGLGYKVGFTSDIADQEAYVSGTDSVAVSATGTFTVYTMGDKLVGNLTYGLINTSYTFTDSDIMNGNVGLPLFTSVQLNSGTIALEVTDISLSNENTLYGMQKVADCAGNSNYTDMSSTVAAAPGFSVSRGKTGISYGQQFECASLDISGYKKVMFAAYFSESYCDYISGDNSKAVVNWGARWEYILLEANGDGSWSVYQKEFNLNNNNTYVWTKKTDLAPTYTNLSELATVYWANSEGSTTAVQGFSEVYAM